MLILSRKVGECLLIRSKASSAQNTGEVEVTAIRICVMSTGTGFCRLGIAASEGLQVLREELPSEN